LREAYVKGIWSFSQTWWSAVSVDWELHRYRKTYADTLHEEGVSVNTIRIRLGHESLDVTLAYLKGKDAESEEAQEHANSSSLALYA
jgi:integrase